MSGKTVLILGGGVGGLVASSVLKDKLGDAATVRLVERKKEFHFPPSYPWLMLGMRRPEQVQRSLSALGRKGIEVMNESAVSINLERRVVKTERSEIPYDYLVVALGAEYAPETILGFQEYAHHIYDLDSTLRFKKAVEDFSAGTIAVGISRLPFKCPAAPYEVTLLLDHFFTKKGARDKIRFEFFTPEAIPVPAVGPEIGGKVLDLLKSRGISYRLKKTVKEIGRNNLLFDDGENIPFDLLFCVPPHRAPRPVVEAGLTNETGWIPVNPKTLETKHEKVYAVGDVTSLPTPSGYGKFLPKAGVFAHGQAEIVAHNIAVDIRGKGRLKEWDGHGACFLEVGYGQSAYMKGRFLAEPKPEVEFHPPSRIWHMQKAIFEKYWMHHWF